MKNEDYGGSPMEEPLRCLIYASLAVRPFSEGNLGDLLTVARSTNERFDITGMLIYHREEFLQFLEGPQDAVDEIFGRICRDPRHGEIATLMDAPISRRHFPRWTMGFPSLNSEVLSKLEGFSDLMAPGSKDLELLKTHVSQIFDLISATV